MKSIAEAFNPNPIREGYSNVGILLQSDQKKYLFNISLQFSLPIYWYNWSFQTKFYYYYIGSLLCSKRSEESWNLIDPPIINLQSNNI